MTLFEILLAILFYIVFSLFGAIGLPITKRIIPNKILAYMAAKIAGLLIFGYAIWLLSSFHLLDYSRIWLILILFFMAVGLGIISSIDFFKDSDTGTTGKKKSVSKPFYQKLLIIEGLTILLYLAYLYLRSFNPAINGTERFMDMAMMNASSKTSFFPFIDPWYAGKTVNYYYYGAYLMSLISKLSHIRVALAYNLSLGLIYAESAMLIAALVWTM